MVKQKLSKRQAAIQELIKTNPIEDQGMLLELLKKNYDISTNQAAISRDLRDLNIYKKARGPKMVYEISEVDAVTEMLYYAVLSAQHNETTIVIKAMPGTANFVAEFIDTQQDLNILGTVAGDNTIFVAPISTKNIEEVFKTISQRLKIKG
jgi:transcriptional regulator of arginine metabolism